MYMNMGMTFDEYWHSDHTVYKYYRKAWKAKREEENYRDWLLGAYFYNAVGIAVGNAFRKKGARVQNYLEEPFPIFPLTEKEKQEKEQKELERMDERLHAWVAKLKAQEENNNAGTGQPIDRNNSEYQQGDLGNYEAGELADET